MPLRVLIRPDGPCKHVCKRLSFCQWLLSIGSRPPIRVKRLPHEWDPTFYCGEFARPTYDNLHLFKSLKDRDVAVAAEVRPPNFRGEAAMEELPRRQARMPEAFETLSIQHMPATPRHRAFPLRVRGLFTNKPLTFQPPPSFHKDFKGCCSL